MTGAINETYEPLGRHLKQPTDGIKNIKRQTSVHKNTYSKIQEKSAKPKHSTFSSRAHF